MLRNRTVYLLAALALVSGCGDGGGAADAGAPDADPHSTFTIRWSLTDQETGAPISCEQVGARVVSARLLPVGARVGIAESFLCSDGSGQTAPLEANDYNITLQLVSQEGKIAILPELNAVTLSPSTDQDLPVTFDVLARGNIEFSLRALGVTRNCASPAEGGAGIVQVELRLLDDNGNCQPATFEIGDENFATTCSGEVFDSCIERNTVVRVSGVKSGRHRVALTASRAGGLACYDTQVALQVPGNDLTADIGAVIVPADDKVEGCVPEGMIHADR